MKRKLLACIATFIIVFGTTLVPAGSFLLSMFGAQTAHAQTTQTAQTTNTSSSTNNSISTTQTQNVTPPPDNQSGVFECGFTDILCGIVKFTNILLNSITNLLATVAGLILDFSIHYSISSSSYSNDTVNTILVFGWKLIRDFSTIFLMFALFVVGFMLIFNAEGSDGSWAAHFSPGRTIARVLIVALLVNFSFLMCRGVIDIGNVFAIVLYDKIDQGNQSVQTYPSAGSVDTSTMFGKPSDVFKNLGLSNIKSISVGLLANINPQRVILDPTLVASNKTGASFGSGYNYSFYVAYLFVSFIEAILNLLILFIFASMAFLFLGRTIGLYLGIILSPFAFVSWTIPFLENMPYIGFDNWLKDMTGLIFLGPVYMLFVYLTVAFMKLPQTIVGGSNSLMVAVFATINALLSLFVLLKGKKIAESMAGELGAKISSFAGKIATAGVGLATGGTGLLASSTLGAAGGILARSGTLKRLEDAGPSQKQEDVQQRMKTASTFRKFGMGGLATSIEKGNFSTSGMLSSAARNVRGMGKSAVTTNPLDAKILGTSVRGLTGKIATAADGGRKPLLGADGKPVLGKDGKPVMVGGILEQSLDKDLAKQTQKGAIMNRALDIAATKNKQNTITNNQSAAIASGLNSNPLASQPSSGKPANSSGPVAVTPGNGNGTTGGIKQNFKLGGNAPITNQNGNGLQRQGFTGGAINPSFAKPSTAPTSTTPPTNPPTPPTGGVAPAGSNNNPPKPSAVPVRLAGNAPIDEKTSGVAMPRTVFNQNLKPTTTPSTSSKENIPSLTGDEEMDNMLRTSGLPKRDSHIPTLTGDEDLDNALRATVTSVPTTKSGTSATSFLSGIQGTAPTQENKTTIITNTAPQPIQTIIQQSVVQQPVQTISKETLPTPIIQTTQPASKIIEQQPQVVTTRQETNIQQASALTGSGSSAIKNIEANQKSFEEKNINLPKPDLITANGGLKNRDFETNYPNSDSIHQGISILNQESSHETPEEIHSAMNRIQEGLHRGGSASFSNDNNDETYLMKLHDQLDQYSQSVSDPSAKNKIQETQDLLQQNALDIKKVNNLLNN